MWLVNDSRLAALTDKGWQREKKSHQIRKWKGIHLKLCGSFPVPFIVITKYTIELQPSNDFSASTIIECYSNFMLQRPERQQQIRRELIIFPIWLWYCFEWTVKSLWEKITGIITLYVNRIILSMLHDDSIIIMSENSIYNDTQLAEHVMGHLNELKGGRRF